MVLLKQIQSHSKNKKKDFLSETTSRCEQVGLFHPTAIHSERMLETQTVSLQLPPYIEE